VKVPQSFSKAIVTLPEFSAAFRVFDRAPLMIAFRGVDVDMLSVGSIGVDISVHDPIRNEIAIGFAGQG
jgi:hypothetical protein